MRAAPAITGPGPGRLAALTAFGLLAVPFAAAHQSLYHNIEVNLHERATVRIFVTVHAPELPTAVAAGIDPTNVDEDWLRGLPDSDLAELLAEADGFIRDLLVFSVVSHGDAPLQPIPWKDLSIAFETSDQIRDPAYDNGLPAGCFLVTIEFANPGFPDGLDVSYSSKAQKRLLLAISRPAAFPDVHDLDAGESVQMELPKAPPPRGVTPVIVSGIAAVACAVAVLVWLAIRRRLAG